MTWLIAILGALCAIAAILEFACLREPKIEDSALSATGRRLVAFGWTVFGIRCIYVVFHPNEAAFIATDNPWRVVGIVALIVLALGRIMITAQQIDATKFFSHHGERRRNRVG